MKKNSVSFLFILFAVASIFGCAGMERKPAPQIDAPNFDASLYDAKVDNFVVVLDASSSMSYMEEGIEKFDTAKKVLDGLNRSLPELGYTAALLTFGPEAEGRKSNLNYGPGRYSTGGFADAVNQVSGPGGNTPLGTAIEEANTDLAQSGVVGETALIVFSDGKEPLDDPVASASKFKAAHPNTCFYTVLVGDDPAGQQLMENIANEGVCGFATTAKNLYTSSGLADFVGRVFLREKPVLPPPEKVERKPVPAPCPDSDKDGVCDKDDRCPNTPEGAKVDQFGCWAFSSFVLFDFDKSVIRQEAYPLLDEVAEILKRNTGLQAIFEGHTDSIGPEVYNRKLSERRADAVMQYILQKGIPAEQVSAIGYGEEMPRATNDTKEGRALNRRVEIKPE